MKIINKLITITKSLSENNEFKDLKLQIQYDKDIPENEVKKFINAIKLCKFLLKKTDFYKFISWETTVYLTSRSHAWNTNIGGEWSLSNNTATIYSGNVTRVTLLHELVHSFKIKDKDIKQIWNFWIEDSSVFIIHQDIDNFIRWLGNKPTPKLNKIKAKQKIEDSSIRLSKEDKIKFEILLTISPRTNYLGIKTKFTDKDDVEEYRRYLKDQCYKHYFITTNRSNYGNNNPEEAIPTLVADYILGEELTEIEIQVIEMLKNAFIVPTF